MMLRRAGWAALASLMLLSPSMLVTSASLFGQATATVSQGITGSVADQTGAAVPDATVIVKNNSTGVETKGATTAAGYFSFPGLVVGTYTVTVSKIGFKTAVRENVLVVSGQTQTWRFSLLSARLPKQ
jgi:Carboxypeptidase regulatory-like domain